MIRTPAAQAAPPATFAALSCGAQSASARSPRSARAGAVRALLAPAAVLVLAATASVSTRAATWFGVRGPVCPLGHWLGEAACPGCGLTRATALAVQGRWSEALAVNAAGFVVALSCVALLAIHADVLRRGAVHGVHLSLRSFGRRLFVVAVIAAWGMRAAGVVAP